MDIYLYSVLLGEGRLGIVNAFLQYIQEISVQRWDYYVCNVLDVEYGYNKIKKVRNIINGEGKAFRSIDIYILDYLYISSMYVLHYHYC